MINAVKTGRSDLVKLWVYIDIDEENREQTVIIKSNLKAYEFRCNSLHGNLKVQAEIKCMQIKQAIHIF